MPEAGEVGYYSDWWNHGTGGPPAWETFHLTEVRQILQREYRAGARSAIAGLSMGGFGALSYAARRPGMFESAASYSGVVNTTGDPYWLLGHLGDDPFALWGDPVQQAAIWAAHNPHDLARRLRGIPLYLSSGDGNPGVLDRPDARLDTIERRLHGQNQVFVTKARSLGLRLTADFYGGGTHTWPYWQRSLHRSFDMLMRSIGAERVATSSQ